MIDYGLELKYKSIFDYLSSKMHIAYKDIDMLSNEIFSKNPYGNIFIKYKLNEIKPQAVSFRFTVKKLLIYYIKSFKGLRFYIANYFVYLKYAKRFDFSLCLQEDKLTVIDTFFIIDKIIQDGGDFKDSYFRLDDILRSYDVKYVYAPVFYGLYSPKNMKLAFENLKKSDLRIVYEYDLLSIADYLRILCFILRYPIKIIVFSRRLESSADDGLLKFALIESLPSVVFHKYIRYLVGRNLQRLGSKNIKIISWFENQTIQKNFYKGVRNAGLNSRIIGAQLLVFPSVYMNAFVDENEICFGTIPDKILVNGEHYLPKSDSELIGFAVGPSMRYADLFLQKAASKEPKKYILILLSYLTDDARRTLQVCRGVDFLGYEVLVKFHPTSDRRVFEDLINLSYRVVEDSIYKLASSVKLVVTAATGSMVEMAALGVMIISVKSDNVFEYNPMLEHGKGVLWREASNEDELAEAVRLMDDINEREVKEFALFYRNSLFSEPTMELIKTSFELEG